MSYHRTNKLIARRVPTTMGGLGDFWSTIKGAGQSVLDFYGSKTKAEGAAEQANADLKAALEAQKSGGSSIISGTTLAIGVAALGAGFLLMRRRK